MLLLQSHFWKQVVKALEQIIAIATLVAVVWYAILSIHILIGLDWSVTATFHECINRALIAIIGLELVRMLLYHNIGSVLELLAFVIARKMLHPELSSLDLMLNTVAFLLLMAARHFLMEKKFYEE